MSNTFTATGNTAKDGAEIRFTPSGAAVASFRMAATQSRYDRNQQKWIDSGDPLWLRVECWHELAEQVAEQVGTGASKRVTVTGHLEARKFTTKEGVEREVIELKADSVCVHPAKTQRGDAGGFSQAPASAWASTPAPNQGATSGWGVQPAGQGSATNDEPPF